MGKDYLTGVLDRRFGETKVKEYLENSDGALIIIDLDNFKMVNDTFGHQMGDHVLRQVADVLKAYGNQHFVFRMGGDEFVIFVKDATTEDEVRPFINAIMDFFYARCEKDEILARTSLSIGIALSAKDGREYDTLFRCADRALYFVKQNGKGGYSFHNNAQFSGEKNEKIDFDRLIEAIRHKGSNKGAFRVEYQKFFHYYEFVEKFTRRNHQSVQLVVLTIDFERSIAMEAEDRERVMHDLEESVTKTLRSVDISTRFSSVQMLVILVDTAKVNVPSIVQRMLSQFYQVYRPTDVKVTFDTEDITMYD